ncbi:MAG: hypothetical protein HC769_37110 [Cyanobacteria bacterium CRU_2_1]|nr:hypothetical protein [Cyanobacteria bacterium CRU_2_1]
MSTPLAAFWMPLLYLPTSKESQEPRALPMSPRQARGLRYGSLHWIRQRSIGTIDLRLPVEAIGHNLVRRL